MPRTIYFSEEKALLDAEFWRAVGKALGWIDEKKTISMGDHNLVLHNEGWRRRATRFMSCYFHSGNVQNEWEWWLQEIETRKRWKEEYLSETRR